MAGTTALTIKVYGAIALNDSIHFKVGSTNIDYVFAEERTEAGQVEFADTVEQNVSYN